MKNTEKIKRLKIAYTYIRRTFMLKLLLTIAYIHTIFDNSLKLPNLNPLINKEDKMKSTSKIVAVPLTYCFYVGFIV